ncbi:hypothetical protein BKA82DRAFT_276342 [Pisolithus tinctorius]|uniref:Uncharacterized protein n=1 Tax=Pisolithus tinctorius Marx 270 TaxID=870435 RepID=A0A0C3PLJ2_PISTI|nr:hypothetical protein BKA82DRAFT_276342 [Pisolithus tinctorius]KIO09611.1 hypothetical protein M404DRAFT_276342 [Pisolithus tinctorius Marx 270]
MRGGLTYDVRAGNTVVVAEHFGGSGGVKSAAHPSSRSVALHYCSLSFLILITPCGVQFSVRSDRETGEGITEGL